jgi:hypothetical protein
MRTRIALVLPLLALAACAKNNGSVFVTAVCSPSTDCKFGATCDAQYIGYVSLDVAVTNTLWTFLEVHNQLADNSSADLRRVNTNDAFIQEYEIDYGGAVPGAQGTVVGSAQVPSNGTAVISVLPIPEATGNLLASAVASGVLDIVAQVRLKGVYGDTTEFKTGNFSIPIRVCNGCTGAGDAWSPHNAATCTAPQIPAFCPQAGQLPAAAGCAAP